MTTFPSAEECRVLNDSVKFFQGTQSHPDEDQRGYAYVEILGVLVFVYLDPEDQVLRISAHFDSADTGRICRNDADMCIPTEFTASGEVVFRG